MPQAVVLKPGQIRHLLRVTAATSRHPERDTLILLLGLGAGLRISEIAQIEVQDVLFASGKLRAEVSLRTAITKGQKQRCAYFTNPKLVAALETYLAYRIKHRLKLSGDPGRYRGLRPETKLILTLKGEKFYLNTKRRVNVDGEQVDYMACDSLQMRVTKLYKDAGIKGGSSHSGRRTLGARLISSNVPIEDIATLLGHAEIDVTKRYTDVDIKVLRRMFAEVI